MFWRLRAKRARRHGRYTRHTRRLFQCAWQYSGKPDDLLAYVLFRRDLGQRLPGRLAKVLLARLPELRGGRRVLACSLCLEREQVADVVAREALLAPLSALQQPAVLAGLASLPVQWNAEQQRLATLALQQSDWRTALQTHLQLIAEQPQAGICMVGNAGIMAGSALGKRIDQHACVVRFNHFSSAETSNVDTGQRLDVWVLTPSFRVESLPQPAPDWAILIGPELQFRTLDWSGFAPLYQANIPVMTLPLSLWRELVRELAAPPSAGIALLAWLHELLGSWKAVSVAGFGALQESDAPYHYTNAQHQASRRHNWPGEQALLQRWLDAGLTSLHA
ncbi:MAG: glycosyltransferase family 29 protein [Thiolinea sp.]